jgi:hypothetical protein
VDDDGVIWVDNEFPYSDTRAAMMLKTALLRAKVERGISARALAKEMNYKQAVVLSHMASGRVAIPLERVAELAGHLNIDASAFLLAAVEQRVSGAGDLLESAGCSTALADGFVEDLSAIAGKGLAALSDEAKRILREVVADPSPARRWLSLAELPVVLMLRAKFPGMASEGLPVEARARLDSIFNT